MNFPSTQALLLIRLTLIEDVPVQSSELADEFDGATPIARLSMPASEKKVAISPVGTRLPGSKRARKRRHSSTPSMHYPREESAYQMQRATSYCEDGGARFQPPDASCSMQSMPPQACQQMHTFSFRYQYASTARTIGMMQRPQTRSRASRSTYWSCMPWPWGSSLQTS